MPASMLFIIAAIDLQRAARHHRTGTVRRVADRLVLGSLPRRMRRRVLKAEKERLRVRPRDHLHGLVDSRSVR